MMMVIISSTVSVSNKSKTRYLSLPKLISTVLLTSVIICNPNTCVVKAADSTNKLPRMEYFVKEDDGKVGDAIYNDKIMTDDIVDSKLKPIINEWDTMINKVELSLRKNKKSDAQVAISNAMGNLKANMRTLAKIMNNGDIIVRNDNGNEVNAEFNFNTGQFVLRPIAQKTEDVINAVNDFYFYESQESTESSLNKLNILKSTFNDYVKVIKSK
jgi:acetylglutamate synthase